ncbi:MAG: hypothetical protein ABIG69_11990 [Bacteroidota bacterium]
MSRVNQGLWIINRKWCKGNKHEAKIEEEFHTTMMTTYEERVKTRRYRK